MSRLPLPWFFVLVACALLGTGCVSQSQYDAKVADVQRLQEQLDSAAKQQAKQEADANALAERLRAAQRELSESASASEELQARRNESDRRVAELGQELGERQSMVDALEQQLADQRALLVQFQKLAQDFGAATPDELKRALEELGRKVRQTEEALRSAALELERERRISQKLQALIDAGKLSVRWRNGRLVIELPGDIHFASGSAKLTDVGRDTLKQLSPVLAAEQDRRFVVEGHTDDVPIHVSGFRNNWHLGSTRAEFAREALVAAGLAPERVAIASWADVLPVCTESDAPECRQRNRRIEVVLLPRFQ
jgi:chemotaxis protein MotB